MGKPNDIESSKYFFNNDDLMIIGRINYESVTPIVIFSNETAVFFNQPDHMPHLTGYF